MWYKITIGVYGTNHASFIPNPCPLDDAPMMAVAEPMTFLDICPTQVHNGPPNSGIWAAFKKLFIWDRDNNWTMNRWEQVSQ